MKTIIYRVLITILIVSAWLVFFDIATQVLLKVLDKDGLNNYFSYGLSTELQIREMFIENIPNNSVLHAGWISEEKFRERGTEADITVYGMSFSNYIADQLIEANRELVVRKIDGPTIPLNHSLSSFLVDKDVCQSKVVVLGVLDCSLKYINSMTNDTIGSDTPKGSFYPQFVYSPEGLKQLYPRINSFEDLQTCMSDRTLWDENLDILKNYDKSYSPFIYKYNILDKSIIGRFIKRWLKSRHNKNITEKTFHDGVFNLEVVSQAEDLISLFVHEANLSGFTPIVILIETQSYGEALGESMTPFLEDLGVDYLNTGDLVSTKNPSNFKADGHFTVENDKKIATELEKLLNGKI